MALALADLAQRWVSLADPGEYIEADHYRPGQVRALIEAWFAWVHDGVHDRERRDSGAGGGRTGIREEAGFEPSAADFATLELQVAGLPEDWARAVRALYRDTPPMTIPGPDGRPVYLLDKQTVWTPTGERELSVRVVRNYSEAARRAGLTEQSLKWHVRSGVDRLVARMCGRRESLTAAEAIEKFLAERTERWPGTVLSAGRLYQEYTDWCGDRGERARGRHVFDRHLASADYRLTVEEPRRWENVRLRGGNA